MILASSFLQERSFLDVLYIIAFALFIQGLRDINESCLPILSRDVLARIRKGDSSWEELVPAQVAALIKERKLFGWHG